MLKGITRTDLFVHDMIHNNPGLAPYDSDYNNPVFLKERGFAGKVFDLNDCAQFAISWDTLDANNPDREKVYPLGSAGRQWMENRQKELKAAYTEVEDEGLKVMFMMDVIVLPNRVGEIYPEIFNEQGDIDIQALKMKEILDVLFDEMFAVFPEIWGIYIRFGETYVGEAFKTPHHFGNNPIIQGKEDYHFFLMQYLQDKVCKGHNREIYYRSWGFADFQYDPATYLRISNAVDVHPKFYFCIKHTAGDFHRNYLFNQSLNIGKHQQIVEVQASREYEGKGAYPNYIGDGVINGFEELKEVMPQDHAQCLRDVINTPDSMIKGLWTWSRGGGWDGPYINGVNGENGSIVIEDGSELWADINAYVLAKWARDTSKSDKYYAIEYAKEILHMNDKDAEIFYEILIQSARAVLLGRGKNTKQYSWDVFWTRDQNVDYPRLLSNIRGAMQSGCIDLLLNERKRSVEIWEDMIRLAQSLEDTVEMKDYIITTCRYGYYLFRLYEVMYGANTMALMGGSSQEVAQAVEEYELIWTEWQQLYETAKGCPTLFEKEDRYFDLIGYKSNKGFDAAINPLRSKSKEELDEMRRERHADGSTLVSIWG